MPTESTGSGQGPSGQARPRQVTMATVLIVVGSVFGVLFTFQRVAGLGSLDLRRSYEEMVSEPPLSGAGVTADTFIEVIRVLSLVVGGAATAAAILGIYVLQRSRSARIGLSVLAPVLFLGGLVVGDFVLMVAAFGVLLLWLHPVSDWYAGRPIPEAARPTPRQAAPPAVPGTPPVPHPSGPPDQPRATPGFGDPPVATAPAPATPGPSLTPAPRPTPVVVAGILTWVACGLTLVGVALFAFVVLAAPDMVLEEAFRQQPELRGQGVTVGLVRGAVAIIAGVLVPWCVFSVVAAVLALRRVAWARTGLLISAVVAAVLSLIGTFTAGGLGLVTLAMSLLTISMLLRPEVRAWFAAPRS